MKKGLLTTSLVCLLTLAVNNSVFAQESDAKTWNDVDIRDIIKLYAESSGESVIVDPRVRGKVTVYNASKSKISFADLSSILAVHNYSTFKEGRYLSIVPSNVVKTKAIPRVSDDGQYAASEVVSDVIKYEKLCADQLVALVRPLVQPLSHFSFINEQRVLFITDTYDNTKRIRALIKELESKVDKRRVCKN